MSGMKFYYFLHTPINMGDILTLVLNISQAQKPWIHTFYDAAW